MKIGTPSRERNCLGVPPPTRTPVPAAGMMARTFINVWNLGSAGSLESRIRDRGSERARTPLVPALAAVALCLLVNDLGGSPFLVLAEDHLPGGGLQDAGDGNVDRLRNHLFGVVHHHHGAVIEVGDPLVIFLAFLEDEDPHDLTRQNDGLERVGELIDVQNREPLELRDLVQVEIVGDDFRLVQFCELNQLHVHVASLREVVLHNLHLHRAHLLHPLQDIESASPAVSLQRIGRVGHELQLAQHELRNDQRAVNEAGLANVHDAAVNDHTCIQDFAAPLRLPLGGEQAAQGRKVQQVALGGSQDQTHVGHQEQERDLDEGKKALVNGRDAEQVAHHQSGQDSQRGTHGGADEPFEAGPFQPHLEEDEGKPQNGAQQDRVEGPELKRTQVIGSRNDDDDE